MRRVAITGIGLMTSLGKDAESTWKGLVEGRSGIGPVKAFDASSMKSRLSAEIPDFDPKPFVANRRSLRMMTRNDQLAVVGATLAVRDSGLPEGHDGTKTALFVGSNKETSKPETLLSGVLIARTEDGGVDMRRLGAGAQSSFPPLFYIEGLQAASLFYVSEAFHLKGANTYFAGTAESGMIALGRAFRAVRRGEAEAAVAGGFDDAASWWTFSKYDGMGLMTDRNELGARACRPYDKERTGTVMGEGAAFMILEEYEAAKARGARIHAEITGFGSASDAYGTVTPHPEGRGLARAVQAALKDAGSAPEAIGYVAAHGSGTRLGDLSEARALRTVFGKSAERLAASSVKAATGHLMAAAGALNAAVAALALRNQVVPPTLNLERVDPGCALDWVPRKARPLSFDQAVAVARGLEGQSAALALRAVRQ